MKMLWNLIQKLYAKEIDVLVAKTALSRISQYEDDLHNRRVTVNYPIGTRVIVRSNEPGPLLIGVVEEHVFHNNSGRYDALLIRNEKTGEIRFTLNTSPIYYSDETLAALNKLTWWEQWNIIAGGIHSMNETEAKRKEAYTLEEYNSCYACMYGDCFDPSH